MSCQDRADEDDAAQSGDRYVTGNAAHGSPHIVALSSVHVASDRRIYHAQACSLARAGFRVTLIARQDVSPAETCGVRIIHLDPPRTRLHRLLGSTGVMRLALRARGDLYVLHDPELLPVGMLIKCITRRPVIFDVHEDGRAAIRGRTWLPAWLRRPASWVYHLLERLTLPWIDALILADAAYARHYQGKRTLTVLNYPAASNAALFDTYQPAPRSRPALVYVGAITCLRGLMEMLELVVRLRPAHPDILLRLIGPVGEEHERRRAQRYIQQHDLGPNLQWTGRVPHTEAHHWVLESDVALALLHPDPNYVNSLPTKMFEYMMMGRPVVVSDFPLWRAIVDQAACGYTVDPLDAAAVAEAVDRLLGDPALRQRMGATGRQAVLAEYSWEREAERLEALCRELLTARPGR